MTATSPKTTAPCFLVGAERSGTTLLRLMLDSHPAIAWCNEFEYAVDRLGDDGTRPDPDSYRRWLADHRIFRATGFDIDPALDYDGLVDSFLRQRRERADKQVGGATVHRHYRRLLAVWPDARFVHLLRDPRDVARSQVGMGWAGNVWTGARAWVEAERERGLLFESVPAERHLLVSYESLVTRPVAELTRICRFLGVEFDPRMLDYPAHTTYGPPDGKLAEQWKRRLSPREVRWVESRSGELLNERGYLPSGLPPLSPSRIERAGLAVQDRIFRARFRFRRYGGLLWLGELAARRLGLTEAARNLRLQLDRIDVAYLK